MAKTIGGIRNYKGRSAFTGEVKQIGSLRVPVVNTSIKIDNMALAAKSVRSYLVTEGYEVNNPTRANTSFGASVYLYVYEKGEFISKIRFSDHSTGVSRSINEFHISPKDSWEKGALISDFHIKEIKRVFGSSKKKPRKEQ